MPDKVDPPTGDSLRSAAIRLINGLRSDVAVDLLISSGWRPLTRLNDNQCRYCPNDVDRGEDGYLHCIECGWTDNPSTIVHLHDRIDELRAVGNGVAVAATSLMREASNLGGSDPLEMLRRAEQVERAVRRWEATRRSQ